MKQTKSQQFLEDWFTVLKLSNSSEEAFGRYFMIKGILTTFKHFKLMSEPQIDLHYETLDYVMTEIKEYLESNDL